MVAWLTAGRKRRQAARGACRVVTKHGEKIKGRFQECRFAKKGAFDKRSLRWALPQKCHMPK